MFTLPGFSSGGASQPTSTSAQPKPAPLAPPAPLTSPGISSATDKDKLRRRRVFGGSGRDGGPSAGPTTGSGGGIGGLGQPSVNI